MTTNLDHFRREFLGANTWAQRKSGIPLDLLDNLSADELSIAENELIKVLSLGDSWPIMGLGHMKSMKALPLLYNLLPKSQGKMKITIAHSIFQICNDKQMIEVVLEETPKNIAMYDLINILYLLPTFHEERIMTMLNNFRDHNEYLVAYNATRALGLPTDEVVEKFRKKNSHFTKE